MRLVNIGNVEPLNIDPSIPFFQEQPTFFGNDFVVGAGIDIPVGVIFVASRVKVDVVEVVNDVELGDRTWMKSLSRKFITRCCVLLPSLVPFF